MCRGRVGQSGAETLIANSRELFNGEVRESSTGEEVRETSCGEVRKPSSAEVRGTFQCGGQGNLPLGRRSGKLPLGRSG